MDNALVVSLEIVKLEEAMNLPDGVFILRLEQSFEDTANNRFRVALAGPGLKPVSEWPKAHQANNDQFDGVDISGMLSPFTQEVNLGDSNENKTSDADGGG